MPSFGELKSAIESEPKTLGLWAAILNRILSTVGLSIQHWPEVIQLNRAQRFKHHNHIIKHHRICSTLLSPSDSSWDEDRRHWRAYGIGCATKNPHIKGVADISIVGFPIRGSTASPPGQACSPPMMLYNSMADLYAQGA